MNSYYCSSCGRHLFKYDHAHQGGFVLLIKCHSCKTANSINFGHVVVTTTTYAPTVVEEAIQILEG